MQKHDIKNYAEILLDNKEIILDEIPDTNKDKNEFFQLIEKCLQNNLKSLEKARLEYLTENMINIYNNEKNKEQRILAKQEAEKKRRKREKIHKLMKQKNKRGQPILKHLAKLQYLQIKERIDKERKK